MELRVRALYTHENDRIYFVNEENPRPAPLFFLARTPTGNVWRFRHDVPDGVIARIEPYCLQENNFPSQKPRFENQYREIFSLESPDLDTWAGPAYWIPEQTRATSNAILISMNNAGLLSTYMEDWLPDIPFCQPLIAVIEDRQAVSICASVRISPEAHEAGLETSKTYRRRGHSLSAVIQWSTAVRETGAIPFYSTSWDNIASQRVAGKLDGQLYGIDFYLSES